MNNEEATRTEFPEFVAKIKNEEILLPDFQRGFVWKKEAAQKMLVASVLAQMPIGNILLFEAKAEEFCCKKVGRDEVIEHSENEEIMLLLDGQQRITVLTNVFSNLIFEEMDDYKSLAGGDSLQKRFFLKIPRLDKEDVDDLFQIQTLDFPKDITKKEPDFVSGDIEELIEVVSFTKKSREPYSPRQMKENLQPLINYCCNQDDYYLLPLFLLIDTSQQDINRVCMEEILDEILGNFISSIKISIASNCYTIEDIVERFRITEAESEDDLYEKLKKKTKGWKSFFQEYLRHCIEKMRLARIEVSKSGRSRAIDIYEKMNLGGVLLSTFDLVMARAAKVERKRRFYDVLRDEVNKKKDYPELFIPTEIVEEFYSESNKDYCATKRAKGLEHSKFNDAYLEAFLNLLSLLSNREDDKGKTFSVDLIKRKAILEIKPESIHRLTPRVCLGLDRALFFLQVRCGIRTIRDIQYKLMLVDIAYILQNDDNYTAEVFELLDAWYWAAIFSGEFSSNQNKRAIDNLNRLTKTLEGKQETVDWLTEMGSHALERDNYSDEELLLFEKSKYGRFPSASMSKLMCQYMLALSYKDFIGDTLMCSFAKGNESFEIHHIIPLGQAEEQMTIGSSTKKLRGDKTHFLNSPLNMIYLTKEANKKISAKSLSDYLRYMKNQTRSQIGLTNELTTYDEEQKHEFLHSRYIWLQGNIQVHIDTKIKAWKNKHPQK